MLIGNPCSGVCAEFLQDSTNPTMIMGACVARPMPGTEDRPAFTALVGSVDSAANKYVVTHRVQQSRLEGIIDLEDMAKHLIKMFQRHQELMEKKTTIGPKRIVFYRNGVSEGQPRIVLEKELPALKRACEASGLEPLPKITIVMVGQPRRARAPVAPLIRPFTFGNGNHTTEATLEGSRSRRARSSAPNMTRDFWQNIGDIPLFNLDSPATADTTASSSDQVIEHSPEIGFFLLGHDGTTTGNPRPTYYSVVHDDNEFTRDSLQELSFDLSHLNGGESGSLSIPAPIYHARLVCIQVKECYLSPTQDSNPRSRDRNPQGLHQNRLGSATVANQPDITQAALALERLRAAYRPNRVWSARRW